MRTSDLKRALEWLFPQYWEPEKDEEDGEVGEGSADVCGSARGNVGVS
jgi:hypothetical protein